MDLKKYRNKAVMKEHKKTFTALHLQEIHSICRVVFLRSFISALFAYFFKVHPYLKSSFSFRNLLPLVYMEVYSWHEPFNVCNAVIP